MNSVILSEAKDLLSRFSRAGADPSSRSLSRSLMSRVHSNEGRFLAVLGMTCEAEGLLGMTRGAIARLLCRECRYANGAIPGTVELD
jgi:hypothetical protein